MDVDKFRHRIAHRRRGVAAVLAGLSVLFVVASLRPAPSVCEVSDAAGFDLAAGEVAVPVNLQPSSVASTLRTGMVVDITAHGAQSARVVASRVRVIEVPKSGAMGVGDGVAVVAIRESDSLGLVHASSESLGVLIRSND